VVDFSRDIIASSWKAIRDANKVTLLTHSKPDGDGIGACLALEILLLDLGKKVETIYPNSPDFEYTRQPENVVIKKHSFIPDIIISCDAANYERLYFPEVFKKIKLINIDHHVSNSIDGAWNFIDPDASSACELLFHLLGAWGVKIDKSIANALLYGVVYDSRLFHTQSTSANTLRVAANLIDLGADLFQLKVELFSNKNPDVIKVWALLLNRIEISKEKNVVSSYITQDDLKKLGVTVSSVVGFINFLTDITDVDVSILFSETKDGNTKVSLRSKEYDVNVLAGKFGGGGHKNAAGILSKTPLDELRKLLVEAISISPQLRL
jgi:phosphoesterase RecJ-like protein